MNRMFISRPESWHTAIQVMPDVTDSKQVQEEVFGPVLVAFKARDLSEALSITNPSAASNWASAAKRSAPTTSNTS